MNGKTYQNGNGYNTGKESQWREADIYEHASNCAIPECPPSNCYDHDSKELWVLLSSAQAIQQTSYTISRLAWALFGLGSLLLLGSLIMAWTYPRLTNTTTTKEISHTKEVINTSTKEATTKDPGGKYIDVNYHYPRALW